MATTSTFADVLRGAREEAGFTQAGLEDLLGLPFSTIAHYESGRREPAGLQRLLELADALGISLDELVGR